jgi:hypothetical protein
VRRRPAPTVADTDVPEWVMHFDLADWIDFSEVPPTWWERPNEWPSFWEMGAWRRWGDAVDAWAAERGIDLWELHNPWWRSHGHTGTDCGPRCQTG